MTGDVGRPVQIGHQPDFDQARSKRIAPAEFIGKVEVIVAASRIVIERIGAGQAMNHEGRRVQDPVGSCVDIGPFLLDPQDLRSGRLRGERIAAARHDDVLADHGIELGNLSGRPRIDSNT